MKWFFNWLTRLVAYFSKYRLVETAYEDDKPVGVEYHNDEMVFAYGEYAMDVKPASIDRDITLLHRCYYKLHNAITEQGFNLEDPDVRLCIYFIKKTSVSKPE